MECYYCKGDLKEGKVPYFIKRKGYHLVIDDVPAYVCQQCGEHLFREEEVELVQQIITELEAKIREVEKRTLVLNPPLDPSQAAAAGG
jgi:YgiT-type zinc finger domain-containing protein